MAFFQRLSGVLFTLSAFFTLFAILGMVTIPTVLASGGTLVAYTNNQELRWQIRYCFIAIIAARINEYVTYIPAGYRMNQRGNDALLWMAPYHAMTIARAFLVPKWLGGKASGFSASGSIKSELNERDQHKRAPLWRRLKVILWDCNAIMHLLYVLFIFAAVVLSIYRAFTIRHKTVHNILFYLLTHAFWPPVIWVISASACLVPIVYAIFPPTMPDREELLERNKEGVARPKPEWKQMRWGKKNNWFELQYSLLTAYTSFLFALTFIV